MKTENIQDKESQIHIVNQEDVWSEIKKIASNPSQEEPFFLCNLNDIVNKHKLWQKLLPRIKPYYAVKCNDNRTVLQTLAALGTGFECVSEMEINKVLSVGVDKDRIIFAHPVKPASHIRYAVSVGVDIMTFDSDCELYKMKEICPDSKLVIRIRSDAKDASISLGMKFGCDPVAEAQQLLDLAKSLNLKVIGVSFHVGAECKEPEAFYRALHDSKKVFDYAKTIGYNFTLLDIGGGYPGECKAPLFHQIAMFINKGVDAFFVGSNVHIIAEPGRYYVQSAFTLVTNIQCIKQKTNEDGNGNTQRVYYINEGIYGSLNCVLNDNKTIVPTSLNEYPGSKMYDSIIWGPTCDSTDLVLKDVMLPEMHLGDWMVFENVGAYSITIACQFNGFPFTNVYSMMTLELWAILKDAFTLPGKNFKKTRQAFLQEST